LQVQGQTFIQALQDLKRTSSTGATGLGQLTEVEGNKIQQAKAALDLQQETAHFIQSLNLFITALNSGRDETVNLLAKRGVAAPAPLPRVPSVSPRVDPRTVTPPVPAPALKPTRTFNSVREK